MRCSLVAGALLAIGSLGSLGCLGAPPRERTAPSELIMALEPSVAEERWYRAPAICGQGPYELDVPLEGARWGEEVELRLATPRRIALHAVILADDAEATKAAAVYDAGGKAGGAADNARCVAGLRERLAASRGGGGPGGGPGAPGGPTVEVGVRVRPPDAPPGEAAVTAQLELAGGAPPASIVLLHHGWRTPERGEARRISRIRIRLWSIEPNDLDGVRFGVRRVVWRPNGTDTEYAAYLAQIVTRDEARRQAREEEQRRRIAEAEERQRRQPPPPVRVERVVIDERAERERIRKQEEARRRREASAAAEAAAEAERRRQRQAFCATHPEDRGCWGAGGLKVHLQFEELRGARAGYCAAHPDEARCWTPAERARRERAWQRRVEVATAPPKQPDGPPPAALPETIPPKLSAHAEWRPGYWQWTGATWAWLGGLWRVPESDIAAEQTTTAPEAPPPPQAEAPPPPPMPSTIWVAGFWQWGGRAWVWVPGSWQVRPEAGTAWRPAEWRARGTVHVLIPGGWIRARGGRP